MDHDPEARRQDDAVAAALDREAWRRHDRAKGHTTRAEEKLAEEVARLRAGLKLIAGEGDDDGFTGTHFVGDEEAREDCPGCIAQAVLDGLKP